ncbi:MAG: hypothetical protein RLZZ26_175 [Candidatus Parcubacteria bacterium]|jgi:flagellar basal body-associated protein FliL
MPPQIQNQNQVQHETQGAAAPRTSKTLLIVFLGIVVIILAILAMGGMSRSHTTTANSGAPVLNGATTFTSEKGSVTVGTKPN